MSKGVSMTKADKDPTGALLLEVGENTTEQQVELASSARKTTGLSPRQKARRKSLVRRMSKVKGPLKKMAS